MEPDLLHWAINFCNRGMMAAFEWFSLIAQAVPSYVPLLLSVFFFHALNRFVLTPIMGGSGSSDQAKKSSKKKG